MAQNPTPRDMRTDPQPGDKVEHRGEIYTVYDVDSNSVYVTVDDGGEVHPVDREWWSDRVEDGASPPFVDPGPDTAPDVDPLADVERRARVLCALLDVVGKAEALPQGHYARTAVEGWLRPVFAALGPDAPERDPRLDPRVGDTKTWVAGEESCTQTITAIDPDDTYPLAVEETPARSWASGASGVTFDDLTLEDWAHGVTYATWTAGGAS